ncbi:thioesterase family protein [Leifsonia sp. H3M29-4]|uniref:thioesterase family protein n=1 Tax=Salinibacterium metalliresistens TaxID=3031321 RepID=UPI0023DACD5C|nr:thioesterase family protein [Salinibacterium metalliresistens]MDF1477830.1 thioesterase family protein [Salinibacterium metalliresistens]
MNKLLRTWWALVRARRSSRLAVTDVGRVRFRVRLTDIDTLRHMNNGVYLSIADLGRFDLLVRTGIWDVFQREGWYPVVANATISYRKSLDFGQRYVLESKLIGIDARAVYAEQRFTVDGEIYARLVMRARFLKRKGGVVSAHDIAEALGIELADFVVPEWMSRWSDDVALPSTKQPARSHWL